MGNKRGGRREGGVRDERMCESGSLVTASEVVLSEGVL